MSGIKCWRASKITGINVEDIKKLSNEIANNQPVGIRNWSSFLERHHGGGQTIRAVTCIPALTGAWKYVGGGITQFPVWEHPYKFDVIVDQIVTQKVLELLPLQLGRVLSENIDKNKPIKSMMCWNANPVTQATETEKIIKGLKREDLFLVSAEHFISDIKLLMLIFCPQLLWVLNNKILFLLSWGHLYLTYNEKCVDPPGEAIPNNEIFLEC